MSHSYYLFRDGQPCGTCGQDRRASRVHIGHSGSGWVFLWRGWRTIADSPFAAPVRTPANWLTILREEVAAGAVIKDSYGHVIELPVFLDYVIAKRTHDGQPARRHSDLGTADVEAVGGDDIAFRDIG